MLSPVAELGIFILMFVTLCASAFFSVRWFLFGLGFVLPLMLPRLEVGVGLDWYKLVGPLAIVLGVLARARGVGLGRSFLKPFLFVIAYAMVVSAVWMFIEYNFLERYRLAAAMEMGGGIAQYRYKMPVQLGSFLGQVLAIFAVPLWARNALQARTAILGVLFGCSVSAGSGAVHAVLRGSGTVNTAEMTAALSIGEVDVNRLGGLSGEPKLLGACLAVVLVYLLARQLFGAAAQSRRNLALFLAGSLALFWTYSTSAWAAATLGIATTVILSLRLAKPSRLATVLVLAGIAATAAVSVGVVASILDSRVTDRVFGEQNELGLQKDVYVLEAFRDNPWDALFGYGLGGGDFAAIPYVEWLHLKYKRTPTAGVTIVRILGDLGVVGVSMIVGIGFWWRRRALKARKVMAEAAFIVGGLLAALFCSLIALSLYFYLAGACLALAALSGEEEQAVQAMPESRRDEMVVAHAA
ncbi:MAG: O-antigen ligase family protein [Polyangiaceae bacterium]